MKTLKIAFLTELFHPHIGGSERRFFEIGRRLAEKGHEIHIFTLQYDRKLPRKETIAGMTVHRYAKSENYIRPDGGRSIQGVLKYSLGTLIQLLDRDFNVCYSNEWPITHSILARPVSRLLIQEWCEVWSRPTSVTLLQNLLKKMPNHHTAVSEFTKQRLINLLGINPWKISVIPNGVDCVKLESNPGSKIWGRIIYVGRLVPHKHIELLLNAFRQVKGKISDAELHIIGSGPLLPSIKSWASGIKDCLLHGFLPENDLVDLLKSAWLFVLPSEREGSGIAPLEAMAAGIPVVTVDFPDNAVKDLAKLNCCLVTKPESCAIASEILRLLKNEGEWMEMSYNAAKAAKRYDWSIISSMMEDFLLRVA
ncbi:MAG: glycosyltransferase family 4 protein [Candidatus Bathyarchaeia archaeon]